MYEYTASSVMRTAFDRAHHKRGQALRDACSWLLSRSLSRPLAQPLSR